MARAILSDPVEAAIRGFSDRVSERKWKERTPDSMPNTVVVFDTETTTDPSQRLIFGTYRYLLREGDRFLLLEEGLFHADDLPEWDPDGFELLKKQGETYRPRVIREGKAGLQLLSRAEFVERFVWEAGVKGGALIVGFNLPFDIPRLAIDVGAARGRNRGGFSLKLWEWKNPKTGKPEEHRYRPRVIVRSIDSKKAFISFGGYMNKEKEDASKGHFLDLRSLVAALSGTSHSLRSAGEAFKAKHLKTDFSDHGKMSPEGIAYALQDALATQSLMEATLQEFRKHPIQLEPWKAYSPASIAKAYLREMGVNPGTHQFRESDLHLLGKAMACFFGGRAEAKVRRTTTPVVLLDFLSMYPTVNGLLGLWRILTTKRITVIECREETQDFLDALESGDLLNRDCWRSLSFFAAVSPDQDVLPVRARYGEESPAWGIGVNPVSAEGPLYYAGPDLAASKVLTGAAPKIIEAFRIVPEGVQEGLKSIRLQDEIEIDPLTEDFFLRVIELRKTLADHGFSASDQDRLQLALKILANSGGYGIYAEMNRQESGKKVKSRVQSPWDSRIIEVDRPEVPGPFSLPPAAALITSGARLMLALLEEMVTAAGGSFAFCDTDSMAIVATKEGGQVPCPGGPFRSPDGSEAIQALSWEQVEVIRDRFRALNPYDLGEEPPRSILEVEKENLDPATGGRRRVYAFAISAKRYVLFSLGPEGEREIIKYSEHGLGHLMSPTDGGKDWMREAWEIILAAELDGVPMEAPWLELPAVSQWRVGNAEQLRWCREINDGKSYDDQIKPANFILGGHTSNLWRPTDPGLRDGVPIAEFERDPGKWLSAGWMDRKTGRPLKVGTGPTLPPDTLRLKTFGDVLEEYRHHPEPKSLGPDGRPCDRQTVGLLSRRPLRIASLELIGKEANMIEDVEAGMVRRMEDVQLSYGTLSGPLTTEERDRMKGDPPIRPGEGAGGVGEVRTDDPEWTPGALFGGGGEDSGIHKDPVGDLNSCSPLALPRFHN